MATDEFPDFCERVSRVGQIGWFPRRQTSVVLVGYEDDVCKCQITRPHPLEQIRDFLYCTETRFI
jgi:hypothetical protein